MNNNDERDYADEAANARELVAEEPALPSYRMCLPDGYSIAPAERILDDTRAIQAAACGHWWQVDVVTGDLAEREGRPVIWAPLAHCGPCEQTTRLLQVLEAIRVQIKATGDPQRLRDNIGQLLEALEPGDLPEVEPSCVRAVAALVEWMPGRTNPRMDGLAACPRRPGCSWGVGHPGPCPEVPPGDPDAPADRWAGRAAIVRTTTNGETYVFPATMIKPLADVVADSWGGSRPVYGPEPDPVPAADREDAAVQYLNHAPAAGELVAPHVD